MNELISIIIPVYQAEYTIRKCVSALAEGTYKNIEMILVDDCSQDESLKISEELAEKYSFVYVLHNATNMGVSYTRNRALDVAHGSLIVFVDCDDWTEPDYIEKLAYALLESSAVVAICGYMNHDEIVNGRTDYFGWKRPETKWECVLSDEIVSLYHDRLLQQLWNKIFYADIIRDNNIRFDENLSMGEDFRFVLRYLNAAGADSAIELNLPLYHYIRGAGTSLMWQFEKRDVKEQIKNLDSMLPLLRLNPKAKEEFIQRECENILKQYSYNIVHNKNMSAKQKKKNIRDVCGEKEKQYFKDMRILLIKEKLTKTFAGRK